MPVKTKIRPVGDRLVVKALGQKEMTKSGILLPETAKEKPQEGEVIAVGSGRLSADGTRVPLEVKVGDKVLFSKYGPTEIKVDGEEFLVLSDSDILCVLS